MTSMTNENLRKKTHRFFVDIGKGIVVERSKSLISIIDKDLAKQLEKVLKINIEEKIILLDGQGGEYLVKITNFKKNIVETEILDFCENKNESNNNVNLYCAILKKENFELVIQKAVEVGVKKIIPIITGRTVKLGLNMERLNKIAKEASEQSGRGIVPKIDEPMDFKNALEKVTNVSNSNIENIDENNHDNSRQVNLLFDISGENVFQKFSNIRDKNNDKNNKKVNIFIGPEGGWSDKELEEVKNLGFEIVSLGQQTLRAETATIIATYLATNLKQ